MPRDIDYIKLYIKIAYLWINKSMQISIIIS